MFCAYRREDAASRGLTGGFGIGPGVSPPLAIGAYRSAGLATSNAPSPQRIDIRLGRLRYVLRRDLRYASIALLREKWRDKQIIGDFFVT